MCHQKLVVIFLLSMIFCGTSAVDPLDFLFSSKMSQYPNYQPPLPSFGEQSAISNYFKRAAPACICSAFLGCHGYGCRRRFNSRN